MIKHSFFILLQVVVIEALSSVQCRIHGSVCPAGCGDVYDPIQQGRSLNCLLCPAGSYNPGEGSRACLPCSPDFYDGTGSDFALPLGGITYCLAPVLHEDGWIPEQWPTHFPSVVLTTTLKKDVGNDRPLPTPFPTKVLVATLNSPSSGISIQSSSAAVSSSPVTAKSVRSSRSPGARSAEPSTKLSRASSAPPAPESAGPSGGLSVENSVHASVRPSSRPSSEALTSSPLPAPLSSPWINQPSADPLARQPHTDPFTKQPHADPFTRQPQAGPFTRQPQADPMTRQPQAEPLTRQPASSIKFPPVRQPNNDLNNNDEDSKVNEHSDTKVDGDASKKDWYTLLSELRICLPIVAGLYLISFVSRRIISGYEQRLRARVRPISLTERKPMVVLEHGAGEDTQTTQNDPNAQTIGREGPGDGTGQCTLEDNGASRI